MPVMLRRKGKATKIALQILGIPQNMSKRKKTTRESDKDKRLDFEDTQRVR